MSVMRNIIVPVVDGVVDFTSGFRIPGRPNHHGVDFFSVPRGTKPPILSFDGGTVVLVQHGHRTSGHWLEILQDDGLVLTYKHLDSIGVVNGQRVARGQQIGMMGKSGNAKEVHLHLEARQERQNMGGRNAFDPMPMLLARMSGTERGKEARNMRIAISSGHGLHVRGASSLIDEVDEARRVANRLSEIMPNAAVFHDDATRIINGDAQRAVRENVNAIVNWHNSQGRDLDVSVHFNAVEGIRDGGMGVETLYRDGNAGMRELAGRISRGISEASGLTLRRGCGTWARGNVGFLNQANINRAVLLEICFVNSRTDVRLYQTHFEAICRAIANSLAGQTVSAPTPIAAQQLPQPPAANAPQAQPPCPPPQAASPAIPPGGLSVRVGMYGNRADADRARDRLRVSGHPGAWTVQNGGMWQAQAAGALHSRENAEPLPTLALAGL